MKNASEEHHKDYLRQLIYDNKIIDAIKYIRDLTGLGLKDSKELCDMFYNDLTKLDDYSFFEDAPTEQETETETPDTREELIKAITSMLLNNKKIMAIKYVKEILKIGLKEAKEFVENVDEERSKKDIVIAGENEDLLIEVDTATDKDEVEEEGVTEILLSTNNDQIVEDEEQETYKVKVKEEKKEKKKKSHYVSHKPFTFDKVDKFDKQKKSRRSNSGCMVTLTLMIALIIIIAIGL